MSDYRLEEPYDPDQEDTTDLALCATCDELIAPGRAVEWECLEYHADCLPSYVLQGREEAARADEQRDGR